jgi:hypothetical protein
MADNVTAGTQAAGFDRAGGFGANEQKDDNSDQIRQLLDQVQELMIEDGADPATAEALTNYARPAQVVFSGNLADLNRMGSIAVEGRVHTPPGQADIEATDLKEAFAEPPAPDLNTGLQTPMGQIDGEGKPVEGGNGGSDSRTKSEIQAELDERGVAYSSSDTKSELLEKLNG